MKKGGLAVLALGVLLAAPAGPSEAQGIRGLIRKKAEEAVKGPEAAKAEEMPGALKNPDVIPINTATMEYVKRGLNVEISERAALTKFLSGIKTQEEYQTCSSGVAMTPEGQKVAMRIGDLPENATQAQMQAAIAKMNEEISALVLKACGEDPRKYAGNWRGQRLREIEEKAAAAAGPDTGDDVEPVAPQTASEADGEALQMGPFLAPAPAAAGMTPRQYAIYKERLAAFCTAIKSGWKPASTPIVKMPGSGSAVWYFTQDEVQDMLKKCEEMMALIAQVT
ncbi:MAG: hypothetical protein IT361_12565 [Gemmatimonadaceae bacterium]|nr:hypothetical protein [Gemmatimonadaceae bacterium]